MNKYFIFFLLLASCCCHKKPIEETKEKIEAPTPAPVDKSKAFSIHREERMACLTLNREHFDPKVKAIEATYHDTFYGLFPFNEDIYIAITDYGSNILILVGVDEKGNVISKETFDLTKEIAKNVKP